MDGTSTGRDAITLANRLGAGPGRLTLAHVIVVDVPSYRNFHSTPAWKEAREMLEQQSEATGATAELTGMFAPSVGSGLHQLAEDCDADLIVVGSATGGPIGRVLIGDGAGGTISGATRPVAVAAAPHGSADSSGEIRTIGVAYNDTAEAEAAPAVGRALAARGDSPVRAMTVVSPIPAAAEHWDELDAIRAREGHTRSAAFLGRCRGTGGVRRGRPGACRVR